MLYNYYKSTVQVNPRRTDAERRPKGIKTTESTKTPHNQSIKNILQGVNFKKIKKGVLTQT